MDFEPRRGRSAHIIVFGNEKGGTGKSTLCVHVATALLKAGQKVATIDIDSRQGTLTHYVENRRFWSKRTGVELEHPAHYSIYSSEKRDRDEAEESEFAAFANTVAEVEHHYDFIIIDTPASFSYMMRLAHAMADTIVSPLNDSFVDFDVFARVDPVSHEVVELSHYSEMVKEARRQRRLVDGDRSDWIVVRNRLSNLDSNNRKRLLAGLKSLSRKVGFRVADGICERVVFRELFPNGVTALDDLSQVLPDYKFSKSHETARNEIHELMERLRLPLNDRRIIRKENRQLWAKERDKPIILDDMLTS